MLKKITNMIKRGVISLVIKDDGDFKLTQVTFLGNTRKVEELSPYGIYTKAPIDTNILLFNVLGHEDNIIGIPYGTRNRIKNLEEGEICVANRLTGSKIYFKKNGDIEIDGQVDININSANAININGSVEPLIRGNAFQTLYNAHTHPDPVAGVTGTPVVPMSATQKSTKNFTE